MFNILIQSALTYSLCLLLFSFVDTNKTHAHIEEQPQRNCFCQTLPMNMWLGRKEVQLPQVEAEVEEAVPLSIEPAWGYFSSPQKLTGFKTPEILTDTGNLKKQVLTKDFDLLDQQFKDEG